MNFLSFFFQSSGKGLVYYLALGSLALPCLLNGQSFQYPIVNQEGVTPMGGGFSIPLSSFDDSAAAFEITLGGSMSSPNSTSYDAGNLLLSSERKTLYGSFHYYPFGVRDFIFFKRHHKRQTRRTESHKNIPTFANSCRCCSLGEAGKFLLPGLSFGLRFQQEMYSESLSETSTENTFDFSRTTRSVLPEIGYTFSVEAIVIGARFSPFRYDISEGKSERPHTLLPETTQARGFNSKLTWGVFVGIRI